MEEVEQEIEAAACKDENNETNNNIDDNLNKIKDNSSRLAQLTIEYPTDPTNGIIPIKLPNLDNFLQSCNYNFEDKHISCIFSYKFRFQTDNKHFPNNTWLHKRSSCIDEQDTFRLKVPLLLLSYGLDFKVTISLVYNHTPSKQGQTIQNWVSKLHSITIPSILMAQKSVFNIGEKVNYFLDSASWMEGGIIHKLLENDMFEIETIWKYNSTINTDNKMVKVHSDKLNRYKIHKTEVMNITNSTEAISDIILRAGNGNGNDDIFIAITDSLSVVYNNLWWEAEIDYEQQFDADSMSILFGCDIYTFLYGLSYNYRVNCLFGDENHDHELVYNESWRFHVQMTLEDQERGLEVVKLQDCWNMMGYACKICSVEIGYFEYIWHCKNEKIQNRHAFCLNCIHSVIQQYHEMEQFLAVLLHDVVNIDCITEIVAYCVGKVKKFHV